MPTRGWMLVVALTVACCHPTALIVTVDTDSTGVGAPTTVVLRVTGQGNVEETSRAAISPGHPLIVRLVPGNGHDGSVDITAIGLDSDGNEVLRRRALTAFVQGSTREVAMPLVDACRGIACRASHETCTDACCVPIDRSSPSMPWTGTPTRFTGPGARCNAGDTADVSLGAGFGCARSNGGRVFCWGDPDNRHFGTATTARTPTVVPLASAFDGGAQSLGVGSESACVIAPDRTTWCWGNNGVHQTDPSPGGSAGPHVPIQVADVHEVDLLSVGRRHVCVSGATDTGRGVTCWGGDGASVSGPHVAGAYLGTLAVDDALQLGAGCLAQCVLHHDGSVACWGQPFGNGACTEAGGSSTPVPVAGLARAAEIAVGDDFACARSVDGAVACWGANASGVLGRTDPPVDATTPQTIAGVDQAVEIAAGGAFACARLADGGVVCWGANDSAQLGTTAPDTTAHPDPAAVPLAGGLAARGLALGVANACAVLVDGRIQCWGANDAGQSDPGSPGAIVTAASGRSITPP